MPHNSVKANILKLVTLRFALVTVMLCVFSGAAFAQLTATFKNYDGTVLYTQKNIRRNQVPQYKGSTPTRPADAQYTYTFKGWSPAIKAITTNTTYVAQYTSTVRKYTITFLNGDGSTLQSSSVAYGSTPSCSSTPTKAATAQYTYTFKAWSPAIAKVTGAATYTPTFNQTVRSYAIKFVDGDGKTVQSSTLQYGATPSYTGSTPTKTATAQYTYTFKAWSPTIAKVTGAATYTATFNQTVRSYTITFKNGSTTLQAKIFNYGATPTYSGSKPTKAPSGEDTFVFTGWTPAITKVTGAKIYSAVFAKGTYDACGNAYGYVKIGDYTWLAENMRCNKYDTKSERAGATISTSTSAVFSPYYTDARDKSLWSDKSKTTGAGLSDAQVSKLGYLYNWAAAVALPTEEAAKAQTSAFSTIRQGICPNGYHVPSSNEWYSFRNYLGDESSLKLRTTTGWAFNDDRVKAGYDTYGFGCLPSGQSEGNIIYYVGTWTYYWTSTPLVLDFRPVEVANYMYVWNIYPNLSSAPANAENKDIGFSVRCLKDHQYTIKFVNYDGTVLQSLTVTESYTPSYTGSTPTKAADAQYTYTFKGWDSTISAATADKTYTATYNKTTRSYTIRFMNGTTVLESKSVAYGTKPTYTKATPTKASTAQYSYTFSGWSPTIASVTKAQDYTAQFSSTVNKYTIKFLNGNGGTLQSSSWAYGATPSCSSTPTKASTSQYSYTFKAWSPAIAKVTGEATYTPTFDQAIRKYVIKFVNYDGTVLQSSEWEYGTTPSYSGATPTRPDDDRFSDYVFEGWNSSITSVTGTKTYTAKFSGTLKPFDAPENEHSLVVIPDICGNKYNVVKIGSQLWLAENIRCNKYDTESERAGAAVPTIPSGSSNNPYYEVYPAGNNETSWNNQLLASQIPYLGTFFSWAAAVGFASGTEAVAQTTSFENRRQGICPNGWHLPTTDEWHVLVDFIELTDGKGEGTAGKHMKTITGWYNNKNGLDTYGFSALPADRAISNKTFGVGGWGKWWTSDAISGANVSTVQVYHGGDNFMFGANEIKSKSTALCVRCVKNPEKFEIKFVNYDGTELQSTEVEYGSLPEYKGDTPVRDADAQYTYTFSGWSPEVAVVTEAATYTAQYDNEVNKYVVRFLNDDGTELQSEELAYGATPEYKGETPTKNATAQYTYTFNGWDAEIVAVTGAKDYKATYTSTTNKYLITFENYNGEELQSGEVEYGQTPAYTGATPVKPADAENTYTFTGWSPELTSVTKTQIYTAQFSSTTNLYTVRFLNEDGTELQSEDLAYGATPAYTGETPTKPATAQYTYTFAGWDNEVTTVTGAKDYKATYTSTTNKYLITFENYNGEELQSGEVEYGQTPSYSGETPEKPADAENTYIFTGWSPELTSVTKAQIYTAQFSSTTNKYVVRFLNDDGTELQSEELAYGATPAYTGETPTKPATAQYTYTFAGWDSEVTTVTGAKDYRATYTSTTNKYLITFENYNGEELQSGEVEYGQTPSYEGTTPVKPADAENTYVFNGWSPEITTVKAAQTYTAQFRNTTNTYIIRFLNEDGTELQSEELEYGATPAYTGETPTKDATAQYTYTFAGWDSEIAEVTGAKDYRATYTSTTNKYEIKFVNYDGSELQSGEVEYGETPAYTGETPEKPADAENTYVFTGWSPSIESVTEAKTYTAQFSSTTNKYVVRFLNDDGTELQSEELAYGATPAYTGETPTKDATAQYTYTFAGWDSEIAEVTGAKDYTAIYTPTTNKYLITFENYNGEELQSGEVEYGQTPAYTGATPEKPADAENTYIFTGWSPSIESVTKAQTYTAQFSSTTNKYVVRFLNDDGTELQSEELAYGATPAYTGETPTKPATAQYTYTFAGWDSEITAVTGAKDYKATYTNTVNKYTIVFKNYDGTELQSVEVEYGQTPTYTGATPEKPADKDFTYTFEGWIPEITTVTAGQTCTAQFSRLVKSSDAPENSHSIEIVTDICGNKYNVVKIGSQLWLAENMRCNKYDTESEKAGQSFSTSSSAIYAPYYTGCFTEGANVTISPNNTFTDEQWDYLGLLYNWAAALGLSEGESRAQTREFNSPRQGICPNGYHVPSDAEWLQLIDYIENTDGKGEGTAAKHLKATSGWAPNTNKGNGLDTYGFSLLPVDRGVGKTIYGIGTYAKFTTASAKSNTFADYMNVDGDALVIVGNVGYTSAKSHIYTVRCVREAEKFEIKFVNYDGSELQSTEVEYGSLPEYTGETPAKDATSQYTYTFSGWSPEVVMVTGAATYTAQFSSSVNKYVVRFLNDDGMELQSEELEYGATPAYTGETPTKDATAQYTYTFNGWDSEITAVTGAKDYTAIYTPTTNKYTVRFLNEDGTEFQSDELEYGVTPAYTGETPTKDATAQYTYTFNGWDAEIEAVTGAKDYTATYTPTTNKYTVRFLNEDGTELQSEEIEYGATPAYTGETPTKEATAQYTYTFAGWDSEIAEVTGAKDYTATYTPTTNKYTVRFLNEDGTELQSEELEYGATPAYTGETPTKEASAQYTYTFAGWDSEIAEVTGAKDYTATYTPTTNKYVVRFLNDDGTELQSEELDYGTTPEYKGETPTKDATAQYTYTFAGWDSEIADVTGAKDYRATYTSTTNKYLIRFLNEDGTELQSDELAYGATPEYKGETPTKDATAQYTYTFAGWDSEIAEVTGAKDYTATYTSTTNKYLITFENYDGEELQSGEVEYGQTPSYEGTTPVKPADAESTYTFSGWSPNITAVTGAQTYTAVFTKVLNTYTVTAEVTGDGGTVSGGGTYSYGTEVTLTATPEHGYHVSKWSTGETSAEIKITVTEDMAFTVSFIHQTADNTPECANAPAVAKYDWLLMLNANALKDKGYNLNENIVDWYRVVGEMDNLDSGERDDEKVGTGYYYTINSKLNDTGDYYALIDLPWQTTEVGCSGLMRTVVFHYAPKGTTKRAMAVSPTITYPEQQIEIVNLPKEEVEVYVYDVAGRLYRSFRTDGEPAAAFKAEPMAGTYIVVVWTSKGKETFKYIVRKR